MLKTISLRITYFLFYVGHTRCTNGVSEFFCRFIVMISHENLCLNHVFMPRRLCSELIFCTRNSVAQKEGQNFSDLALLARAEHASLRYHAHIIDCQPGCTSLIAKLFSGSHTAVEPKYVFSSMHVWVGGFSPPRFRPRVGRGHEARGGRLRGPEAEN